MIETVNFRTKSLFMDRHNPTPDGCWPIALDIGYSGVKGFSPNSIFAFPSYARNLGKNPSFYGDEMAKDEILYRDSATGNVWRVGRSAQLMIDERDTEDSQSELFGRDRYYSQMFMVILRTGLALGVLKNAAGSYNGCPVYVQTGLPPAYLEEDRDTMVNAIAGSHNFAIRTGTMQGFLELKFNIRRENVYVMSQPEGTLMSVAMDDNGNTIPDAKKYFQSNIIIFDAGFGTLDLFDIKDRAISSRESFSQFGMRAVLDRTGEMIRERTGVRVRPSAMQNCLEKGTVTVKKRSGIKITSRSEPFTDLLEGASDEICKEAIEKTLNVFPNITEYECMVLTGGTSAAWEPKIRDCLSGVEGLSVVSGNVNCPDLDLIFTNVRGYYMCLVNLLRRRQKRTAA